MNKLCKLFSAALLLAAAATAAQAQVERNVIHTVAIGDIGYTAKDEKATVGNVLAGDDEQTQQCLNLNVVEYLGNLLASSNPLIVKEAAWCLSNITAGTVDQVQVRERRRSEE